MIIFGWGAGRPKDLGPALPFRCPRCHNDVVARYFIVTRWFSLFFIPLIPYGSRHVLVCPICTYSRELTTKEEQARAVKLVELTSRMQNGTLGEQMYRQLVDLELGSEPGTPAPVALPPPPPAES